jgi:hypothetical protein
MNRVVRRADMLIDVDMISATLYNQLDRDLAGAFVPKKQQKNSTEQNATQEKQEDPFVANTKDGKFQLLTFITCNPLQVYPFAKNVTPQPRVARVAYILELQDKKNNRYRLMRKESTEKLEYKDFNDIRGFELARNITKFNVTFRYTQEGDADDDKKPKRQKVEQWPMPDKEGKKPPAMPEYVTIKLTLTDERGMREQSYTFGFTLYGFNALSASTILTPTTQTDTKQTGTQAPGNKQQTNSLLDKLNAQAGKQSASGQKTAFLEGFYAPVESKPRKEKASQVVAKEQRADTFNMDEFEKVLKELELTEQKFAYNRDKL